MQDSCHRGHSKPIGPIYPRGPGSQDEDTGKGEKAKKEDNCGQIQSPPESGVFSKLLLIANLAAAGISQARSFLSYGPN